MHPERIVPDETEAGILAIHLKRYEFALRWCTGRDVLDAACGVGYGTAHAARVARSVTGVDFDADAIAYANARYALPNVTFRVGDVERLEDADATYDTVCSFETIEHVEDPERALSEFARVLRTRGTLVVSTPNAPETTCSPANPFHRVEWSARDFAALLRQRFVDVDLYGQRRVQTPAHRLAQRVDVLRLRTRIGVLRRGARLLATRPTEAMTLDDQVIECGSLDGAPVVVAVCSKR